MLQMTATRLRVAHVVFRFAIGGMENGIVNLINGLPERDYWHDIVCLTDFAPDFASRVKSGNVTLHRLDKRPGNDFRMWGRLYRLFRQLRPDVAHTRNFGTLEAQLPAWIAGVPVRIHGEHGWDVNDLQGASRKFRLLRGAYAPCVHHFVTVSRDLQRYLIERVGIAPRKVTQIYNGVDSERFRPAPPRTRGPLVIGAVGRLMAVKNHSLLLAAFLHLLETRPELRGRLRLRIVGDGPLRDVLRKMADRSGFGDLVELDGAADNVPRQMQGMDVFVLPSLAEGISNTILEAMATGLPVLATRVGGNGELVQEGRTGFLVPAQDEEALAGAISKYIDHPALAAAHGAAGRQLVEERFSLQAMVDTYDRLYKSLTVGNNTKQNKSFAT